MQTSQPVLRRGILIALVSAAIGCGDETLSEQELLSAEVLELINLGNRTTSDYTLPSSTDFAAIPQDPSNSITTEKVALGQMLYHDTAFASNGVNPSRAGTWSCASCHHVAAGFKAGIPQGIGEGGEGFGSAGEGRRLAMGFDTASSDMTLVPDVQPIASPTSLNSAYQEVMLWNGQFGNATNGVINSGLAESVLSPADTPKAENSRQLAGLETQAIAGLGVHRMAVETNTPLQTNATYQSLYNAAYPNGGDVLENAGKAIAAYERTLLANEAPFQRWLRGDTTAMTVSELRGAALFFGKANCVACHTGPALSSAPGATESEMFFAVGFSDFSSTNPLVNGAVPENVARGRGGFTNETSDDYKFKIPPLYNLRDTNVFGHGASFTQIRDVVMYKNLAVPQSNLGGSNFAAEFVPLNLSTQELDDLTAFLTDALYDANLARYVPTSVPSGDCFPNADTTSRMNLNCP